MTAFDPTTVSEDGRAIDAALESGDGVLRLAPAWVPRAFCTPGRRLRLHPDDYFPFGPGRGGIDERWLSSAVRADNGPETGPFEGLSMVVASDGETLLPFDVVVDHLRGDLIGERLWDAHRAWPMYSKFFDNAAPLPFHVHHRDEHAALVDKPGKPEAYYYPPQMNTDLTDAAVSFLGLIPGTTREDFSERLAAFGRGGDNRITELAHGFRTRLSTGWDVPPGVLHAPAAVCTYEPQAACDVFCMCESWSNGREVDEALIWKDVPAERRGDLEFILDLIDWDANTDPHFFQNRFMAPRPTDASTASEESGWSERWIVYRSSSFSAKELVVEPGAQVRISDSDAYGTIIVQGRGRFGAYEAETAGHLRYGQLSRDEYFVSESAAKAGVVIANESDIEPLVMLKHFGPGHREQHEAAVLSDIELS